MPSRGLPWQITEGQSALVPGSHGVTWTVVLTPMSGLRRTCVVLAAQLQCRAEATMAKSRRHFLATTSLGLLGAAALPSQAQNPADQTPGNPPAFGTGPLVGP